MKDLVSIIVPVYNVEKYIDRCMKSMQSQTYNNIEIVLVDDGSSDNSGIICDEYAERDERVHVIHQKNGGVSRARNVGIEHARGEYITFVDPDDWIEVDTIEVAVRAMQQNNLDVVLFGYSIDYENGRRKTYESCKEFQIVSSEKMMLRIMSSKYNDVTWSTCGKVYAYKIAKDIRFPEGIAVCEDLPYCWDIITNVDRVGFIPDRLYHYYMRTGSVTSVRCSEASLTSMKVFDMMHSDSEMLRDAVFFARCSTAEHCAKEILITNQAERFEKELAYARKLVSDNLLYMLSCRYIQLKTKIGALLVCLPKVLWKLPARLR